MVQQLAIITERLWDRPILQHVREARLRRSLSRFEAGINNAIPNFCKSRSFAPITVDVRQRIALVKRHVTPDRPNLIEPALEIVVSSTAYHNLTSCAQGQAWRGIHRHLVV